MKICDGPWGDPGLPLLRQGHHKWLSETHTHLQVSIHKFDKIDTSSNHSIETDCSGMWLLGMDGSGFNMDNIQQLDIIWRN